MFRNAPAAVWLIAMGAFALGMASYVTAGLIPMIGQAFSVEVAVAAQLVTAFTLAYGIGSPLCVARLPAHSHSFSLANSATSVVNTLASATAIDAAAALSAVTGQRSTSSSVRAARRNRAFAALNSMLSRPTSARM